MLLSMSAVLLLLLGNQYLYFKTRDHSKQRVHICAPKVGKKTSDTGSHTREIGWGKSYLEEASAGPDGRPGGGGG